MANPSNPPDSSNPAAQPAAENGKRKRALLLLTLVFFVAAIGYGLYWSLEGRYRETTDDAYVSGNLLRVTPRVSGTVVAVLADDSDFVKRGQVLVQLDDTDAKVALHKAEADLAATVRQTRQLFEQVAQQKAGLAVKQVALQQAQDDVARRDGSDMGAAVSREEVQHAQLAEARARSELQLTQATLAATEAAVSGTTVQTHPAVQQAEQRVREAWLNLARCQIRAPEDGYIAKRGVQVGQQLAAGTPLMAVVPLQQLWVEANFKEDQLQRLRIGQEVDMVSDLYGSGTVFHGEITGLSPGTGGVFSLLPPQNATGNWIKIVQRVPVRVALDSRELAEHPLRVGLSLKAVAHTRDTGGAVLASGRVGGSYSTNVYAEDAAGAEALIKQIIAANLPR